MYYGVKEKKEDIKMRRMTKDDIAKMVMMRGIGYQMNEISDRLQCNPATVSYQLRKLKKEADTNGYKKIFFETISYIITDKLFGGLK